MIRASEQWTLFSYIRLARSRERDRVNELGPFRLQDELVISRHMDCINYEACLTFAAKQRWASFSCEGCRKTSHGKFVESKKPV